MKKFKLSIVTFCLCCLLAVLTACGSGSKESKLVGSWASDYRSITFYDDGTYTASFEYGTGKWTILDNGDLKLTDFYGTTTTTPYTVDGDTLSFPHDDGTVYSETYTRQ